MASLLTVILMERMDYLTEVLRALLLQLIHKSVTAKHPQLMLRRTESVVEKMLTNWLALAMFDYVREEVGAQLFLLFSALKRQVEKGPVDAVTHEARYSLSEERLLREHYFDYEQIVLQVHQEEEKVLVRVLDCDSVSQVKNKLLDALFKNTPFSLRPSLHDLDLQWRHGRGSPLTLQDEDMTSKSERINTLRHYGLKNWAVVSLVPKDSSLLSSDVDNDRFWHLVRPADDLVDTKDTNLLHKAIPEIFLTRLLATKGTVQKFVDDFFLTILSANQTLPGESFNWLSL